MAGKLDYLFKTFELIHLQGGIKIKKTKIQAGAELGQAQLKLGLDFTLILFRFGFTGYSFAEVVW